MKRVASTMADACPTSIGKIHLAADTTQQRHVAAMPKKRGTTMQHKQLLAIMFGLALLSAAFANVAAQTSGGKPAAPQSPAMPNGTKTKLTYQGRLTNSSGAPVNSPVNMVFRIYNCCS